MLCSLNVVPTEKMRRSMIRCCYQAISFCQGTSSFLNLISRKLTTTQISWYCQQEPETNLPDTTGSQKMATTVSETIKVQQLGEVRTINTHINYKQICLQTEINVLKCRGRHFNFFHSYFFVQRCHHSY